MFSRLIDFISPESCAGCQTLRTPLCGTCIDRIPQAPPPPHLFITSLFDYRHPAMKRAIWRFKYENARSFAKVFAPYLYDEVLRSLGNELFLPNSGNTLLVPIPLHKKRLRERGYNQSDLLVREVVALDTAGLFSPAPDLLVRTRDTKPQAKKEKRKARLENLRDAFICPDPGRVHNKTVILIDDVTTTGATLQEAKRALMKGNPRKVLAVTVGH